MSFWGFVQLGDTAKLPVQVRDGSSLPKNADAAPRRHVYSCGSGQQLSAGSGQSSLKHTGTVTGAAAGNPTTVTSAAHGLETGARIYIAGLTGLTSWADGYYTVTKVDANSFTVAVSTTGTWTSGGTWNVAGLYEHSLVCSAGNGFQAGKTYMVLTTFAVGGTSYHDLGTFTVT